MTGLRRADAGSGPFAKKTLEQAVRATDGKTARRRRNPRGVTKRCGRIAELGPHGNHRQAAGGTFFRPADWVFDREWPRGVQWSANFRKALGCSRTLREVDVQATHAPNGPHHIKTKVWAPFQKVLQLFTTV